MIYLDAEEVKRQKLLDEFDFEDPNFAIQEESDDDSEDQEESKEEDMNLSQKKNFVESEKDTTLLEQESAEVLDPLKILTEVQQQHFDVSEIIGEAERSEDQELIKFESAN